MVPLRLNLVEYDGVQPGEVAALPKVADLLTVVVDPPANLLPIGRSFRAVATDLFQS